MTQKIIITFVGIAAIVMASSFFLGNKIVPQVQVNDQSIQSGKVVVSQVDAVAPSWLVIQVETNGVPGVVVGYKKINKGTNKNVAVDIDTRKATPKLFAMIHEDNGEKDKFDFPNNDTPLMYKGEMVSKLFTLK